MKNARTFILTLFCAFAFCTLAIGQSSSEDMPERYTEVTYESATVYTGKTDYSFKNTNGRLVQISFSNFEENQAWNPVMPDNMLESREGAEGVPGPNPELVGKTFLLIYSGSGDMITEVRLKE